MTESPAAPAAEPAADDPPVIAGSSASPLPWGVEQEPEYEPYLPVTQIATITVEVGPEPRRWLRARRSPYDEQVADWRWVEQWRLEGEPTPWGPGLALSVFAALVIGAAVYVISIGLIDRPLLTVAANVVVAAGLAPALWMSRQLPVLRWVSLGGIVGTLIAWISILFA